jgi:uncharacterized protein YrrD
MMAETIAWRRMRPGWPVLDRSGKEIGRIHGVMGDRGSDVFNGLLVENGPHKGTEYVPAEQVTEIRGERVTVNR